jgi:hypothetical protein
MSGARQRIVTLLVSLGPFGHKKSQRLAFASRWLDLVFNGGDERDRTVDLLSARSPEAFAAIRRQLQAIAIPIIYDDVNLPRIAEKVTLSREMLYGLLYRSKSEHLSS